MKRLILVSGFVKYISHVPCIFGLMRLIVQEIRYSAMREGGVGVRGRGASPENRPGLLLLVHMKGGRKDAHKEGRMEVMKEKQWL